MFALAAARDLVIAALIVALLSSVLGRLTRPEVRPMPTIHTVAADGCRALSLDECRAFFFSAQRAEALR